MRFLKRNLLKSALKVMVVGYSLASCRGANGGVISDTAYPLLGDRVQANRRSFDVYEDSDSGLNHGFPSGFFANNTDTLSKIHLDAACLDDTNSANGCCTDTNAFDRVRGTVLRISFDPLLSGEYAGVNIEEPEHWGVVQSGIGYDLSGATGVVFDVRTPSSGGVQMQFGVGGGVTGFLPITSTWTTISVPFNTLSSPPLTDLTNVHILFAVAANDMHNASGGTILLDNIRFEPVPTSRQSALGFPLSTETFGSLALQDKAPSRVPIPSDQVLRNLTTTYESALTSVALLERGTPDDENNVRLIADTFHYALYHDNHGLPLPAAPDGSVGLHNGYESGDIGLFNDQTGEGQGGKRGDVRLAGFSASTNLCGPSGYCLVLDGATGGNNAFAILALVRAYQRFGDTNYLNDARTIGRWIVGNLTDTNTTSYGGYFQGYPDEGQPKLLILGKSIENNADIFAAFTTLAAIERQLGNDSAAGEWTNRANVAGDFVMQLFDPVAGRFYAGTVPVGTPASDGIDPTGPQRGNDVINVFDFLDSNSFTTMALAGTPRYRDQINWRRPVQHIVDQFAQSITVSGQPFQGFNIVKNPTAGSNGVAWEFTGQAIVAMRFADNLYCESRFETNAVFFLDQIRQAQASAPFSDGRGLVASTLQDGGLLPPLEQCLSTPFQCIPERVGLAATTWAIFADQSLNPFFADLGVTRLQATLNFAKTNADSCTVTGTLSLPACYSFAGKVVTLAIGDAQVSFTLSSNGSGRNGVSTFSKPTYNRKTGLWTFSARLKNGSWQTSWADYGMVNATIRKPGSPVNLPVMLTLDFGTFMGSKNLLYTATTDKSGTAK